jgi:hypothetical protein
MINKMVQCSECGCIAFPDAIHCPKCGANYREGKTVKEIREVFEKISSFSTPASIDMEQSLKGTCYQFICPHHSQVVDIIVMSDVKCPLGQGN